MSTKSNCSSLSEGGRYIVPPPIARFGGVTVKPRMLRLGAGEGLGAKGHYANLSNLTALKLKVTHKIVTKKLT